MSITTEINEYLDNFLTKSTSGLDTLIVAGGMTGEDKALVISKVLDSCIVGSLNAVKLSYEIELLQEQITLEQKRILDIESTIAVREAQSTKDLEVKDKQILDLTSTISTRESEAQASIDLKVEQLQEIAEQRSVKLANLTKDGTIKDNQATLIVRQTTAYDDNLRVEKSKSLVNYAFGHAVGGTVPPPDLETNALASCEAIYTT
jgi:hypothetical protein